MHTDICFFNQTGEHVGSILENLSLHRNSWKKLNNLSEKYGENPIPIAMLSKGILLALIAQGGIPSGAVFIQR